VASPTPDPFGRIALSNQTRLVDPAPDASSDVQAAASTAVWNIACHNPATQIAVAEEGLVGLMRYALYKWPERPHIQRTIQSALGPWVLKQVPARAASSPSPAPSPTLNDPTPRWHDANASPKAVTRSYEGSLSPAHNATGGRTDGAGRGWGGSPSQFHTINQVGHQRAPGSTLAVGHPTSPQSSVGTLKLSELASLESSLSPCPPPDGQHQKWSYIESLASSPGQDMAKTSRVPPRPGTRAHDRLEDRRLGVTRGGQVRLKTMSNPFSSQPPTPSPQKEVSPSPPRRVVVTMPPSKGAGEQ